METSNSNRVQILDGSFGFQIRNYLTSKLDDDPLWSSRSLQTHPEAVIKTHMDYIQAGSDIIETNTYQASMLGFMKYLKLSEQESYELIKKAVSLTKEAIVRCEKMGFKKPLIAGSVGPYGAYLHDGSEYSGYYAEYITAAELEEFHKSRIDALVEAGVDLLAIETIPSRKEALVLVEYIKKYPTIKAWLSFSCKTDGLSTAHGDNFRNSVLECFDSNSEQIIAVGVNCIAPNAVESLLSGINKNRKHSIPLIVYANSGESFHVGTGWDNKCDRLETYIPTWLNLGVKYIGGCCRVYANYMVTIKEEVTKWEQEHSA